MKTNKKNCQLNVVKIIFYNIIQKKKFKYIF